jgi:hypothetical protein
MQQFITLTSQLLVTPPPPQISLVDSSFPKHSPLALIPTPQPPVLSPFPVQQALSLPLPFIPTGESSQKTSFSAVAQATHFHNPKDPSLSSKPNLPSTARARAKLTSLQHHKSLGQSVCFRCDDQGHVAPQCRNSLVYFACGRLGHRSHQCKSITMFQPPPSKLSTQAITKANALPILKFYPTPATKKF